MSSVPTSAITESNAAPDAPHASDELLRSLFRASLDGIAVLDLQGRIVDVNDAYCRASGYGRDELLGMSIGDIDARENAAETAARIARIVASGGACFETRHRRKDGTIFEAEVSVSFHPGDGGHLVVFQRDVTERKRAERALEQSESRYRALVEATSDCIWECDAEGRFTYLSPNFENILGIPPETFLGRTPADLPVADGEAMIPPPHRAALSERTPVEGLEYKTRHRDGHIVEVEVSAVPVFAPSGEFTGMRGVTRNVTKRNEANRARVETEFARQATARLGTLADAGVAGVNEVDREGRYVYVNDRFCAIVGRSREELLRMSALDLTHPDDRIAGRTRLAGAIATGKGFAAEKRYVRGDGSTVWVLIAVAVNRGADGAPIGCVGMVLDITERKRKDEALRVSEARQAFLVRLADAVRTLPNPDDVRFEAARLLAEQIGANRVGYAEDAGDGEHLDVARNYARGVSMLEGRYRYDSYDPALLREFRAGHTVVRPDIANDPGLSATVKSAYAKLGLGATISVPLLHDGQLVAILYAHSTAARQWTADEVALCEEVARRVWADVLRLRSELAMKGLLEKLREANASLERTQFALESVGTAILWADAATGRFLFANAQAARMLGYSIEELTRLAVHDIDVGLTETSYPQMVAQIRDKGFMRFDSTHRRKDGSTYPVEISVYFLKASEGIPERYIAFGVDITERKRAEVQLSESERSFRGFFENALVGTAQLDVHGRFQRVNRRFCEMLGYTADELVGQRGPLDLTHPDDIEADRGRVAALLAGGTYDSEKRFVRKDGGVIWVHAVASAVCDESGQTLFAAGVVEDITRRKRSEESLRALTASLEAEVAERTAQLTAASAAKSEFLAHMSHEIRTPMNAVINFAQLLQEEPLTPEQSELVGTINEAGQSLLRIINDILDFSKIEAGQLQIERHPFEVAGLLNRVGSLLGGAAEAKGLRLNIGSPPGPLRSLAGDALRLEQVLVNLINNAIKFTEKGGITLNVATQAETADGVRLRFEVRDTGIGIAPDELKLLFQPFSQADRGITRRFGGTGLGLVISKQIVEMMGGQIGVTSDLGHGSTFWFEIPFAWAEAVTADAAPAKGLKAIGPQLAGLRVLAADDNQVNLLIVDKILKSQGATTVFAADGQQALQILQANPEGFDVVLMDVQMPIMDGLTATRAIRADPVLAHLPVIALTAGVLEKERDKAVAVGINDFLPKPLDPKQMIRLLAAIRVERDRAR